MFFISHTSLFLAIRKLVRKDSTVSFITDQKKKVKSRTLCFLNHLQAHEKASDLKEKTCGGA